MRDDNEVQCASAGLVKNVWESARNYNGFVCLYI